ncbi:MAG: DUF1176 domain-containing protein [Lonepinella koalarum]|nr:DUF1176 domain-containing protein [Lonepinella koalarum]
MLRLNLGLLLALFSFHSLALEGFHFEHKDWEIACDNTGTCRMAGYGWHDVAYNAEEPSEPISILFIREAGNKAIEGFIKIQYEHLEHDNAVIEDPTLWLNGKTLGKLAWQEEEIYKLSAAQTERLLLELIGVPDIQIRGKLYGGDKTWFISSTGSTAVMKKMDEFQQRLNTPTALVQKGKSDKPILAPQPVPTIKLLNPLMQNSSWVVEQILEENPGYAPRLALLKKAISEDECSSLGAEGNSISVQQLSAERKLVGSWCNDDSLLYVLTDSAEKQVFWHSTDYTEFEEGKLYGSYKMRGLGDCWLGKEAVWNGKQFIKSDEFSTGQCRGFNEGSWMLPTLVSEVIE